MRNKIITTHYLTSDFTIHSRISFFQDLVSDLSVDRDEIRLQKNNMMVSIHTGSNTICEWYYISTEDETPDV